MKIKRLDPGVRSLGADARISLYLIRENRWGWICEVRRSTFTASARDDGEYSNTAIAENKAIEWAAFQGALSCVVENLSKKRHID